MSIFSKIKDKFGRKKYDEISDLDQLTKSIPKEPLPKSNELQEQQEKIHLDNLKTKIDLVLTDLDNLKTQNQMINERLKNIEKVLFEMKGVKYY